MPLAIEEEKGSGRSARDRVRSGHLTFVCAAVVPCTDATIAFHEKVDYRTRRH